MSNSYIKTPLAISYNSIIEKDYTLSSSQYMDLIMPNKNFLFVRDFLSRDLKRKDLGIEVGSLNYIGQSTHFFIRTKALQSHSFLPDINSETALPIMPNAYSEMNLKEGDLLISKDSNIGEIIILDKDYPNYMLSGAIYKLPVNKNKYYLLAFIKHNIFREQLDFMVPKGATIRHAKTMFLDCKIPMPNFNADKTINFIEVLTQAIINKENLIKQRHQDIFKMIETELLENQKPNKFVFKLPKIKEIEEVGRLDTGIYSEVFKRVKFTIDNYKLGISNLFKDLGYKSKRGQNLAISVIGESVYSNIPYKSFYELINSSLLTEYGTLDKKIYLGNSNKLVQINYGDIIFSATGQAETSIGKSSVILDKSIKKTSNFNSFFFFSEKIKISELSFVSAYFRYLKSKGYFVNMVGKGNGGSFTEKHFQYLDIPNFLETKQQEIAKLYHNSEINYDSKTFTLENFLSKDNEYIEQAGIYELDKTAKQLKEILNTAIESIVNDQEVKITFN